MNFTEYALKNRAFVYFFVFVLVVGGIYSFFTMSKLEDPAITVKQAMVVTAYPGASAYQVELEVTDVVEKAIRSMGDLDHVSSRSMDDVSEIMVELSSTVPLAELQQKWDILRRKVMGAQAQLPDGAQPSIVMDDFGDVYGMFYAMTSDGFDYQEMSDYAELVRRSVLDIDGVSSVDVYGERQSCINVEFLEDKMANMGVHPAEIIMTLNGQVSTNPWQLFFPVDFAQWAPQVVASGQGWVHISYQQRVYNIFALVLLGVLILAVALAVTGAVRARQAKKQ